jgi:hypothetical protein
MKAAFLRGNKVKEASPSPRKKDNGGKYGTRRTYSKGKTYGIRAQEKNR